MQQAAFALWLALAMVVTGSATVLAQEQTAPSGLHLAFGPDASSQMRVSWLGPDGADARLEIRPDGASGFDRTVEATSQGPPGSAQVSYHAEATDLEPNTTYEYRVAIDEQVSDVHTFTTGPAPGTEVDATITAFADHGTVDPANSRADGENPQRVTDLAAELDPVFHLHAGDTSYAEGDPRQWNAYFEQIEPLASKAPYMAVPGNHEREEPLGFQQYATRFNTATEDHGLWYSFQYGSVLVVGLNSERACVARAANEAVVGMDEADDCETGEPVDPYKPQLSFVEETLQAAAEDPSIDWRLLVSHHLFWSSSSHAGSIGLQDHYMPLMDRYGVDIVVQAHDHVYERSKPLHDRSVNQTGIVYLTNGAAGSGTYGFSEDQPTWSAFRDNDHYGVLVLEIQGDELHGRFETLDDGAIDAFDLVNVDDHGVRMMGDGLSPDEAAENDAEADEGATAPAPGLVAAIAAVGIAVLVRGSSGPRP